MSYRETFDEDYDFYVKKTYRGGYSVSLPHQCGNWEIIGADVCDLKEDDTNDGGYPANPKDKALAINQMKLFILRANEALEELEQLS